jgi:hypothetical protein
MMQSSVVPDVRKGDVDEPAASRASWLDQKITDESCHWMACITYDGRADRVVVCRRKQGNDVAMVLETTVGVAPGPILVKDVAKSEVLDAGAADVDK